MEWFDGSLCSTEPKAPAVPDAGLILPCSSPVAARSGQRTCLAMSAALVHNTPHKGGLLPIYDVAATADALGIDEKQLDNIISRNDIPGIDRARRGTARRIAADAVVTLRIALELVRVLKLPTAVALTLAQQVQRCGGDTIRLGEYVSITVDLAMLRASTSGRLDAAVESIGRRPRGRPPARQGSRHGPRHPEA